ncbi:MAG: hypothetical protein VX951_05435, partial [Planctomycetota bacterium]|nr:hypothetical protein [Planctomycetota bacterium]
PKSIGCRATSLFDDAARVSPGRVQAAGVRGVGRLYRQEVVYNPGINWGTGVVIEVVALRHVSPPK